MSNKGTGINRMVRERERANDLFLLYEAMGRNRSLLALCKLIHDSGNKANPKTLAKYSKKYGWQQRLLERTAKREASIQAESLDIQDEMTERHVSSFKDLMTIAKAGMGMYKDMMMKQVEKGIEDPLLPLELKDIINALTAAQKGERLSRGLVTSRAEVIVEVVGTLVKEFTGVFLAVNVMSKDDAETISARVREFARRSDEMLAIYAESLPKELGRGKE